MSVVYGDLGITVRRLPSGEYEAYVTGEEDPEMTRGWGATRDEAIEALRDALRDEMP